MGIVSSMSQDVLDLDGEMIKTGPPQVNILDVQRSNIIRFQIKIQLFGFFCRATSSLLFSLHQARRILHAKRKTAIVHQRMQAILPPEYAAHYSHIPPPHASHEYAP